MSKLFQIEIRVLDVTPHSQIGTVNLQDETSLRDRFVLMPHRLGDGEQIGFFCRVEIVPEEERDDARRRGAHEPGFGAHMGHGVLEVSGIDQCRLGIRDAHWSVASRCSATGSPGVAKYTLGHFGELNEILVYKRLAGSTETSQPFL